MQNAGVFLHFSYFPIVEAVVILIVGIYEVRFQGFAVLFSDYFGTLTCVSYPQRFILLSTAWSSFCVYFNLH